MKKTSISIIASSIVLSSVLMLSTGCGSSSSGSASTSSGSSSSASSQKSVTAVDGYIIGATISDAKGTLSKTNASGVATASFDLSTPLTSNGGVIDANSNGKADAGELLAPTLKTPAGKKVISPLTDLVAHGVDATKLANSLGISEAELYSDPIKTNKVNVAKAMQIVYAVIVNNKTEALKSKINATTLPGGSSASSSSSSSASSSNASGTGNLPDFGRKLNSNLPDFGSGTTASTSEGSSSSSGSVASTGSLQSFATLVKGIFASDANVTKYIDTVVSTNATSASKVEQAIESLKVQITPVDQGQVKVYTGTSSSSSSIDNDGSGDDNNSSSSINPPNVPDVNSTSSSSSETNSSASSSSVASSSSSSSTSTGSKHYLPDF